MIRLDDPRAAARVCLILGMLLATAAFAREGAPLLVAGGSSYGPAPDMPVVGTSSRSDTLDFGFYDPGTGQAVLGEQWTFDHGAADALEGWTTVDARNPGESWRRISAVSWDGHGNSVAAPIALGTGAAWCGRFEDEADADCWTDGLGYGNRWSTRILSPPLTYSGSGTVSLSFRYFTDLETNFDYANVRLLFPDNTERAVTPTGMTGKIGDPTTSTYALFAYELVPSSFDPYTGFRIVFEMTSDGGWSDEDGDYTTTHGPFGVDDISLTGSLVEGDQLFDFEGGDHGFTTAPSPVTTQIGVRDFALYGVNAPCACTIAGNVLEVHDEFIRHPAGQREFLYSPPVDRAALGGVYNYVFAEYDVWTPILDSGTAFRPGWSYYPWTCPVTGAVGWSPPMMQNSWFWWTQEGCLRERFGIDAVEVPGTADQYRFVLEVVNDCAAFGLPSTCNEVEEPGPLFDNLRIRVTRVVDAPAISFSPGCYFQDGFGQGLVLSTTNSGNADVTFDLHQDNPAPDLLGDSLAIVGPLPTASTQWEARMWWRIRREGPGQPSIPNYGTWRTAIADGLSIVGPNGQFTFGRMDSMQIGASISKNRFISEFREDDDDFAGEGTNNSEMIRDGILAPGTQIEYFISASYVSNPANYVLPDTTGRNYLEFEILPSYRLDAGISKFPCTLTIDLNSGDQRLVEPALNQVLNGAGLLDPVPNPTRWDRYDYNDATSTWNAPLARSSGGNNGLPLPQLLAYRTVLLYAGSVGEGAMEAQDFVLLHDWMQAIICDGNLNRQGFIVDGHNIAERMTVIDATFASYFLGSSFVCGSYRQAGCGPTPADDGACVRLEAAGGAQYTPIIDYDAVGNACPDARAFDVLAPVGGGIGNRVYHDYDGAPPSQTPFAQIVRSVTGAASHNFRAVLDGTSYGSLSSRGQSEECSSEFLRVTEATSAEIQAALEWIFGGAANIPKLCSGPCWIDGAVEDEESSTTSAPHLFPATPNPFNPRTTLRFTLPAAGEVQLDIYDVAGRRVRRLADGNRAAGLHEVAWDGTDNRGHTLPPGVYWAQLRALGVSSNKRLVQVR